MAFTYDQKKKFTDNVFDEPLEKAVEWIAENLEPIDVFAKRDLERWAIDNDFASPEAYEQQKEEIARLEEEIDNLNEELKHGEDI